MMRFATKCPECGSTELAQTCLTWVNTSEGVPSAFDDEDLDSAAPAKEDGGTGVAAICRDCAHYWTVGEE